MMLQTEPTTPRTPKIRLFIGTYLLPASIDTFEIVTEDMRRGVELADSVPQSYAIVKNHPKHDVKRLVICGGSIVGLMRES